MAKQPEQPKPAQPTPPSAPAPDAGEAKQPEQPKRGASGPDCAETTPEIRAHVDKAHGPQFRILAVGKTQIIICDDPAKAGTKVPKP